MNRLLLKLLRACHLISEARYRDFCDYLTVEKSPLFDAEWYLQHNPDVRARHCDPVWHYCRYGWREGRLPGPKFQHSNSIRGGNPLVEQAILDAGPMVSIVVASYNYAQYIRETLDSLLMQTYSNFEIVVVDDGSKDDSVSIIKEYVQRDSRVRLFMHHGGVNRGLPATVKLGVQKSRGTFVAFCESDDLWEPAHLEAKIRLILRNHDEPNIIINDILPFGDEGRVRAAENVAAERMRILENERNVVSPDIFRGKNMICTFSCCMVRRRVLAACDFDGVPRPANLDWWLWRQICCVNPLYVVHEKLTRWRMHQSFMASESAMSITRQREFIMKMDALLVDRYPKAAQSLLPFVREAKLYELRSDGLYERGKRIQNQPFFSIITPTYNRRNSIARAIDSALSQTYPNFELVIVDDGSVDGTEEFVRARYAAQIASGKIRYHYKANSGVCKTRNVALGLAKGDWIAYLDSDNELCPFYLEVFARAITVNPSLHNLYAKQVYENARKIVGKPFNLAELIKANFIDLGVYVHRRSLVGELGGFDENMTRLVDWELIVRQSKVYTPIFINEIVMLYNDGDDASRVTNSAKLKTNMDYFKLKHCDYPVVTTMITAYNHSRYIKRAIESALIQQGEFVHEVIVADDHSTDNTSEVLQNLANEYPDHFRILKTPRNLGIAENMRRCFAAAKGEYIAVLEGDDYWITPWKLNRQVRFLRANPECSMVFSRIKLLDEATGKFSLLPRQSGLKSKLTGEEFIRDPNQNLIANFSSCMFVSSIVKNLPLTIYAERVNEISMAFYLEQKGPIGFLSDIMSVYRLHNGSTWSTADKIKKLESAIRCREVALKLCATKYKAKMQSIIDGLHKALAAEVNKSGTSKEA